MQQSIQQGFKKCLAPFLKIQSRDGHIQLSIFVESEWCADEQQNTKSQPSLAKSMFYNGVTFGVFRKDDQPFILWTNDGKTVVQVPIPPGVSWGWVNHKTFMLTINSMPT